MRISIRTKKRRFLLLTGQDAEPETEQTFVSLSSADLSVVPEEEFEYEEEEDAKRFTFGFR